MKIKKIILSVSILFFLYSCSSKLTVRVDKKELSSKGLADFPVCRFYVMSDPHIYSPELGTEGKAFQSYIDQDRKLLKESSEILDESLRMIAAEPADFLLVCGDITKDGSLKSHQLFKEGISILEKSGTQVFVVPGNHDLNNPHAHAFKGDKIEKIEALAAADFADFYQHFGYDQALFRDKSSLSYVAEPVEDLWLLMLDSADYEKNYEDDYPQTDGRIRQEQLNWMKDVLEKALEKEKAVMACMHHGVLEHYRKQEKFYGQYLVDQYQEIAEFLALYGVRLVFTGHYHAQDITMKSYQNKRFLYDIETGSLVTYPCPMRFITIQEDQNMEIKTLKVEQIASFKEEEFQDYARKFVWDGIHGIAIETMTEDYSVPKNEAEIIAPFVANAFLAHYEGDEAPTKNQVLISKEGIRHLMSRLVLRFQGPLVLSLWQDLAPADNNVRINLKTGDWNKID